MKIPVFEEIVLNELDYDHAKSTIEHSRIGKVPCYINLSTLKKTDLITIIPILEKILEDLKLHSRFPYPTYLITHLPVESTFPVVTTAKELPDHFFKKVKRPSNKELQLLNKLGLKVDKLNNLDRKKIMEQFQDTSTAQRQLYELSKELYFLETIHEHLNFKEKIKK